MMSLRIAGDIEQMRSTVATMRQSSQALREHTQQSRQALDALRGSMWSGRHRQMVESRWEAIEPRFNPTFAELEDLAARIERVVNALEAAGAQFGGDNEYRNLSVLPGGGPNLFNQIFTALEGVNLDTIIPLLKGDKVFLDIIEKMMENGLLAKYIPEGSKVSDFVESAYFPSLMFIADAAIGIYEDMRDNTYGDDTSKLIGTNLIDSGVKSAIATTGIGFATLLVNDILQLGAPLQVSAQKTMANWISTDDEKRDILQRDADNVESTIERMDLDHVTKRFSEAIYDSSIAPKVDVIKETYRAFEGIIKDPSYENILDTGQSLSQYYSNNREAFIVHPGIALLFSDKGQQGLYDTGKEAVKVLNGASDYMMYTETSLSNMEVAAIDKTIDVLPVSDTIKHLSHNITNDIMERNQRSVEQIIHQSDTATEKFLSFSDQTAEQVGDLASRAQEQFKSLLSF